jgi:hypothetical protein
MLINNYSSGSERDFRFNRDRRFDRDRDRDRDRLVFTERFM